MLRRCYRGCLRLTEFLGAFASSAIGAASGLFILVALFFQFGGCAIEAFAGPPTITDSRLKKFMKLTPAQIRAETTRRLYEARTRKFAETLKTRKVVFKTDAERKRALDHLEKIEKWLSDLDFVLIELRERRESLRDRENLRELAAELRKARMLQKVLPHVRDILAYPGKSLPYYSESWAFLHRSLDFTSRRRTKRITGIIREKILFGTTANAKEPKRSFFSDGSPKMHAVGLLNTWDLYRLVSQVRYANYATRYLRSIKFSHEMVFSSLPKNSPALAHCVPTKMYSYDAPFAVNFYLPITKKLDEQHRKHHDAIESVIRRAKFSGKHPGLLKLLRGLPDLKYGAVAKHAAYFEVMAGGEKILKASPFPTPWNKGTSVANEKPQKPTKLPTLRSLGHGLPGLREYEESLRKKKAIIWK